MLERPLLSSQFLTGWPYERPPPPRRPDSPIREQYFSFSRTHEPRIHRAIFLLFANHKPHRFCEFTNDIFFTFTSSRTKKSNFCTGESNRHANSGLKSHRKLPTSHRKFSSSSFQSFGTKPVCIRTLHIEQSIRG